MENNILQRQKRIEIARRLSNENKIKDLNRLYFLAGLIIRNIDDLDMANYMREFGEQINKFYYRTEVLKLHKILFEYLTERQKYFFGYKTDKKYTYGMDSAFLLEADSIRRIYFGNNCPIYRKNI